MIAMPICIDGIPKQYKGNLTLIKYTFSYKFKKITNKKDIL